MVGNDKIRIASTPRTGTTWFLAAMKAAGVKIEMDSGVHKIFGSEYRKHVMGEGDQRKEVSAESMKRKEIKRKDGNEALMRYLEGLPTKVAIVRNPADWLLSYFGWMTGRSIGVSVVDAIQKVERFRHKDWGGFIPNFMKTMPDQVATIFEQYTDQADVVLWMDEDFPEQTIQLLESVGCKFDPYNVQKINPINVVQGKDRFIWEGTIRSDIEDANMPRIQKILDDKGLKVQQEKMEHN